MDDNIKSEVKGRWNSIFDFLGVDVGDGRHKDCPICGSPGRKKPFRYDNIDGNGTWYCTYCGAGDGWRLLMMKFNWTFPEAIIEVRNLLGICAVEKKIPQESVVSPQALRLMFTNSKPMHHGDIASWYLQNRGITVFPPSLRSTTKCYLPEDKQYHNAMLGIFTGADNVAKTIHRTYLDEHGSKLSTIPDPKRIMPTLGKMAGGAIRLFEPSGEILGVAEGIETAIAAHIIHGNPVWSTVSSALLSAFEPPPWVKLLVVYGDNDTNYAGQKAAYSLAHKMVTGPRKMNVLVMIPNTPGHDWLDVLNDKKVAKDL